MEVDLESPLARANGRKEGAAASGEEAPNKKKKLGQMAGDADEDLAKVEGALRGKDIASALSRVPARADTKGPDSVRVDVARALGRLLHRERREDGGQVLRRGGSSSGRAAFKAMVDNEEAKGLAEPYEAATAFYTKCLSVASLEDQALVIHHFRVRRCYREKFMRLQFSIAEGFQIKGSELTKLLLEQAVIRIPTHFRGRLKLGSAPVGHIEQMAPKLLDRTKRGPVQGASGDHDVGTATRITSTAYRRQGTLP
ncbi:unnamed protein product [Prorocentrum cordatum]|uniref:Uncharacterized protein n=1 Tax=Prorocentrum cordatum TaxID=2364126 RepID=A0ABN9UIN7_9DINO|nr:unnamed protein product [Polarella glacialis]